MVRFVCTTFVVVVYEPVGICCSSSWVLFVVVYRLAWCSGMTRWLLVIVMFVFVIGFISFYFGLMEELLNLLVCGYCLLLL